jgi:hypothetical protein
MDYLKSGFKIGGHNMKRPGTTPGKLKVLLIICIAGVIISLGVNFLVYNASLNAAETVGKDTVPSIVSANRINALLANAHSNAMNAMVTKEKSGGRFWTLYRKDMADLHSELTDISRNMVLGDAQRSAILAISSNVGAYEYTLGGAVSDGAEISVDQFGEANRLMQQKILPASVELNRVYSSYLDAAYKSYINNMNIAVAVLVVLSIAYLVFMIVTQVHLFRKTHRIFNIGMVIATLLFIINMIYSVNALSSVRSNIYTAKHDAFDSIQALWNARATAYNANALESLYLLHNGTGIVQTADTINFNLSASLICDNPKAALDGSKFGGYLGDEIQNITFEGEEAQAASALAEWTKYVEIDKQIRSLEYDSKHDKAIALFVGGSSGQSNYQFIKLDEAIGKTIDINQAHFDSNMKSAFKTLSVFPYWTLVFLLLIASSCVLGLKPRIEEYKA